MDSYLGMEYKHTGVFFSFTLPLVYEQTIRPVPLSYSLGTDFDLRRPVTSKKNALNDNTVDIPQEDDVYKPGRTSFIATVLNKIIFSSLNYLFICPKSYFSLNNDLAKIQVCYQPIMPH